MATLVVKDFPNSVHRELKAAAAMRGLSIKDLFIRITKEWLKSNKGK